MQHSHRQATLTPPSNTSALKMSLLVSKHVMLQLSRSHTHHYNIHESLVSFIVFCLLVFGRFWSCLGIL